MNWYPLLVAIHVVLAVSLLAPNVLLPFLLSHRPGNPGPVTRGLLAVQGRGGATLAAAVAVSGVLLLVILGIGPLGKPWLLVALALYAANLAVAVVLARPNLRRLLGVDAQRDQVGWRRLARRQRWLAYAMGGVIGVIGLLMSTKPSLW